MISTGVSRSAPAKQEPATYRVNETFGPRPVGTNFGVDFWSPNEEVADMPPEFGVGREFEDELLLDPGYSARHG